MSTRRRTTALRCASYQRKRQAGSSDSPCTRNSAGAASRPAPNRPSTPNPLSSFAGSYTPTMYVTMNIIKARHIANISGGDMRLIAPITSSSSRM